MKNEYVIIQARIRDVFDDLVKRGVVVAEFYENNPNRMICQGRAQFVAAACHFLNSGYDLWTLSDWSKSHGVSYSALKKHIYYYSERSCLAYRWRFGRSDGITNLIISRSLLGTRSVKGVYHCEVAMAFAGDTYVDPLRPIHQPQITRKSIVRNIEATGLFVRVSCENSTFYGSVAGEPPYDHKTKKGGRVVIGSWHDPAFISQYSVVGV